MSGSFYLPEGLSIPVAEADGLSAPYWQGLRENVLKVQRCSNCGAWQWGPEWLCHQCHSFDLNWVPVDSLIVKQLRSVLESRRDRAANDRAARMRI